jgi:hypothetical protein
MRRQKIAASNPKHAIESLQSSRLYRVIIFIFHAESNPKQTIESLQSVHCKAADYIELNNSHRMVYIQLMFYCNAIAVIIGGDVLCCCCCCCCHMIFESIQNNDGALIPCNFFPFLMQPLE